MPTDLISHKHGIPARTHYGTIQVIFYNGGGVEISVADAHGARTCMGQYNVHRTHDADSTARARRLALAWNACDGISNEDLEIWGPGSFYNERSQAQEFLAERDLAREQLSAHRDIQRVKAALAACEGLSTSDLEIWGAGFFTARLDANVLVASECEHLRRQLRDAENDLSAVKAHAHGGPRVTAALLACNPIPTDKLFAMGIGSFDRTRGDLIRALEEGVKAEEQLATMTAERDALAAQLAAEKATSDFQVDDGINMVDQINRLRDGSMQLLHAYGASRTQVEQASALLREVHPVDLDQARRIIAFLEAKHEQPVDAESSILAQANALIALATASRVVVTVTHEPLEPLAMGNYRTVAAVHPMREKSQ